MMFDRKTAELMLYAFLAETTVETPLKLKIQSFVAKPYTSKELYQFLSKITDISERLDEPDDDDAQMIDLDWCEDQFRLSLS